MRLTTVAANLVALLILAQPDGVGATAGRAPAQLQVAANPTPPPLPQPAGAQYFYSENGKPIGPFSLSEIQAKLAAGLIKPETLVWKSGTPSWVAAKDLPEIAQQSPPTAPSFDIKKFLVGTWQSGPTRSFTLASDGTMTRLGGTVINGKRVTLTGTFTIEQTGEKRFTLKWSLESSEGGNFVSESSDESFEIVDNNTLRDTKNGSIFKRAS